MKKWVFWLVIVILLVYEAIEQHSAAVKDNQSKVDDKAYVVTSPGKELTPSDKSGQRSDLPRESSLN